MVDPDDAIFGSTVAPHDLDMTLLRYLKVARSTLSKRDKHSTPKLVALALQRLLSTLQYRREYDVLSMHAPGAARKILHHDTNPGACLYAADAGLVDRKGNPALIGRLGLMIAEDAEQHEPIVPANHLRAILFAFERLAASLKLSEGREKAWYILDCSIDRKTAPDLYNDVDPRPRFWSKFGRLAVDGLTMKGWNDANTNTGNRRIPGVLPHLPTHTTITPGFPVLREALRQLTEYYPNVMEKVYFVRAPFSFRAVLKVFSLMVDRESAARFVVVPWGKEADILGEVFHERDLPVEFGGSNNTILGRDDFLRVAEERYEEQALFNNPRDGTPMDGLSRATIRSRFHDETAEVSSTKEEAISIGGGTLISGEGVTLYTTDRDDELPLGTFHDRTELVLSPRQTVDTAGRTKLLWPVAGWVELP